VEVYLDVFVLLLALAAVDVYVGRRDVSALTLAFGVVLLVLFIGLRWETGNDWTPYLVYFENEPRGGLLNGFEPGYRELVLLAHRVGLGYTGFMLLSASIYMSAFAVVFSRFRHPSVLLLFFYCGFLLGFMGTQRQALAMGFTSIAMLRFYDRKFASGAALCLLATSFHYTALISLAAAAVPRSRLSKRAFVALLVGAAALYHFDVAGALVESGLNVVTGDGYLGRRLLAYSTNTDLAQATGLSPLLEVLWLLKRVVLAVLFWILCSRRKRCLDNYLVNLYAVSVVLFLATYKAIPILALRGPLYFGFVEIVLTYIALQRLGGWFRRESLLILGGILGAARLYAAIILYAPALYLPYKSVVLNTDYLRFMY
jgi:hypothetical protein